MTTFTSNLRLGPPAVDVTRFVHRCYRPRPLLALAWHWCEARWARWRRQRAAAIELRGMGERDLRDLGIGRCEVEHLLDHA
jgi:uncharacterized protein YjiS (DUF1127 family)